MALIVQLDTTWEAANKAVFMYGAGHLPCIVVDCANFADPHRFYPDISLEQMQQMYVFELELLHRFRDVLRHLPVYAKRHEARCVIVTTADHLINYRDQEENRDIYLHAWELMKKISAKYTVLAAVRRGSDQQRLAQQFCDTIWEKNHGTYRYLAKDGDRYHSGRTAGLFQRLEAGRQDPFGEDP